MLNQTKTVLNLSLNILIYNDIILIYYVIILIGGKYE